MLLFRLLLRQRLLAVGRLLLFCVVPGMAVTPVFSAMIRRVFSTGGFARGLAATLLFGLPRLLL